jgi:CRP-like cAMP-binding protein
LLVTSAALRGAQPKVNVTYDVSSNDYGRTHIAVHKDTTKGLLVSDFLDTKRKEIAARLRELEPLVDEYRQLEAAAAALADLPATPTSAAKRGRPTARAGAAGSAGTPRRRGRPRGSGTRALQAFELVKARPGITTSEIASSMGIKQNYLYRVLPSLEKDAKVDKRGRGWFPR